MTSQQAALAAGATAALAAWVLKAPLWAAVLAFAGGALVTEKAIEKA
jgi:hypothetical protein